MKNLSVLAFLLFYSFAIGQSLDVEAFDAIKVSGGVQVNLIQSDKHHVDYTMIEGEENQLIIEVKGSTLHIKTKKKTFSFFGGNAKANAEVYYTQLEGISSSAGSSITSEDPITASMLRIDGSSGSSIQLDLEVDEIDVKTSSGASLSLKGKAESGTFKVSSGGNISADRLTCNQVVANASSGGRMDVHAVELIKAKASSGGNIQYSGNPEQTHIDGGYSGQIQKM